MTVAVLLGFAGPALAISIVGTVTFAQGAMDRERAQLCADKAAIAAATNGNVGSGRAYASANGCSTADVSIDGALYTVIVTYGHAAARAVAGANPVRLIE